VTGLPDRSSRLGKKFAERLQEDIVIWLTTVGADGTPQPNPVWFIWDGESFLTYNRPDAHRIAHIRDRPRVSLNFDGNRKGGNILVITGDARPAPDAPPPDQQPAYLDKYRDRMIRVWGTPKKFAEEYPVPIRIHPTRFRGL
jgi:PPOX class probable F420-dependent enzyme